MTGLKIILALLIIVVLASFVSFYHAAGRANENAFDSFARNLITQAVWSAESMLSGLEDSGYRSWTPQQAAAEAARTLQAASQYDPSEGLPRPPGPDITYVVNAPTGPWQVVLVPLDATREVRIDGYATDEHTPVLSRTVPCPGMPPAR